MKNHVLAATVACSLALAGYAADPKTNWNELCVKCHGPEGKGDTKMGKKLNVRDYTDAKVQDGFTDEQAFKALKEGIKDKGGATRMKPVEGLSDAEINCLVACSGSSFPSHRSAPRKTYTATINLGQAQPNQRMPGTDIIVRADQTEPT